MPARTSTTSRSAELKRMGDDARSALKQGLDLSDLDTARTKTEVVQAVQQRTTGASTRLQAANEFGQKMQQELGQLCIGIEQSLAEIGYSVSEAYNFRGAEKFWAFLGKFHQGSLERAKVMRIQRLETQTVEASVQEIVRRVLETIKQLGEIEHDYEHDGEEYKKTLTYVIQRLKEAQPGFKETKGNREDLEAQVKTARLELESGTVSEDERPEKEETFEALQRDYQKTLLKETELLEVINNAQRAIPEVQKSRDAAQQAIQAIRQMRRGLLEKQQNFQTVLENAMTAVRARARLERYENIDPAFNKNIALLTEHNVKVSGAAMQIAIERAAKAALDPNESLRLAQEIRGYIEEYMKGLENLEGEADKGVRVPTDPEQSTGSVGGPRANL